MVGRVPDSSPENVGGGESVKMEESSYVPNSIPPALVVFSQAGYTDAIRMQRPFGTQASDAKDLNLSSLSPSSFGLRPMDSYPGLAAGLVHLQNPFLHPALEARLPFGTAGAFRPVVTSSASPVSSVEERLGGKCIPSPFSSANLSNRRKMEEERNGRGRGRNDILPFPQSGISGAINLEKSPPFLNGGQSRHRSCSPANSSPNHREKQQEEREHHEDYGGEERDVKNGTPNSDATDRSTSTPDDQMSKRRRRHGEINCPVCKLSLHPMDMESHLLQEVEQLICISQVRRQQQARGEPMACSSRDSPNLSNLKNKEGPIELPDDSRWETFQRVRNNRHTRLRLKTKRRREDSGGSGPSHPPMGFPLSGRMHGSDHMMSHLDIRKNGDVEDEDEPVDIEGDGDMDSRDGNDYEIWNNRRVLKSSRNSNTPINMTATKLRRDDEIDVDGEDFSPYGAPQYTESDIQTTLRSTPEEGSASSNAEQDWNSKENKSWYGEDSNDGTKAGPGPTSENINLRMVIQVLKSRIRALEKGSSGTSHSINHCLLCNDESKKPVVSISCWHIHCEKCWLQSLGSKKLCPQCNVITSAADLRRISLL